MYLLVLYNNILFYYIYMSTSFPNYKEYLKIKKYDTSGNQSSHADSGLSSTSQISDIMNEPIDKLIDRVKIKKSKEINRTNRNIASNRFSITHVTSDSNTLDSNKKKSISYSNYKEYLKNHPDDKILSKIVLF